MAHRIAAVERGSAVDPCCCGACCLYPWPGYFLDTYFYPDADLPDTILVNGTAFTRDTGFHTYTGATGVLVNDEVQAAWNFIPTVEGDIAITSACLIGDYQLTSYGAVAVEAVFDAVYTMETADDGDVLIEQNGVFYPDLCTWSNNDSEGAYRVAYNSSTYKWQMFTLESGLPMTYDKTDPQDGPAGTYGPYTVF